MGSWGSGEISRSAGKKKAQRPEELNNSTLHKICVKKEGTKKPFFRPAKDDSKPLLQDPILRSDQIETEEAVLRLPSLPDCFKSKSQGP